ncbi:MAG: peptidylprolyl isomerase [Rhodothermales bacterium]|nr:peptidylprolyl isomerase [Rhodothermales bacterium]
MRKPAIIVVLIAAAASAAWLGIIRPAGDDPVAVADVDGVPITVDRYRTEYAQYLLETGLEDTPMRRRDFLERLISVDLLVREQNDNGVASSPEYEFSRDRVIRKLLIEGYLARAVYDSIAVREQDLRQLFLRTKTTLKASHLYAPTLDAAATLHERLQRGERFEDLAREHFEDPALAENGGSLGYFGFDEMDPAFEEAAYALEVGEISPPVRTAQGYSVIRLDDRLVKPVISETEFAERKANLSRYVVVRRRQLAKKATYDALLEEIAPRIDEPVLAALFERLVGTTIDRREQVTNIEMNDVLVELDGRTLTVGEFFDEAVFASAEQRTMVRTPEILDAFLEGIMIRLAILRRARGSGIEEAPEFKRALEDELRDWTYERAWEALADNLEIPEDSLRSHFTTNRAEFRLPEQVFVREILLESREEAIAVRGTVTPDNFSDTARRRSVRPRADERGGALGFVARDQLGVLADRVFSAESGDILGPIEVGGRYVVLYVGERKPEREAEYADAKDAIRRQLEFVWLRKAVRDHARELRGRYPVTIFDETLGSLQLRQEQAS